MYRLVEGSELLGETPQLHISLSAFISPSLLYGGVGDMKLNEDMHVETYISGFYYEFKCLERSNTIEMFPRKLDDPVQRSCVARA